MFNLFFQSYPCKVTKFIATFAKNSNEMTAEREIAGFAFPFAAGTALSALLPSLFSISFPHTAILSSAITGICLAALSHPRHNDLDIISLRALITFAGLFCGALCAYTYRCIDMLALTSAHTGLIHGLGDSLEALIESIPFENSQTNALINALICSDRSGLDIQTKDIFRQSGASHILALSGMHLGIIYAILKFIFIPLGNSRCAKVIRSIFIMAICTLYTVMTGAGASIVRALIFIISGECAMLLGRSRSTAGILYAALIIQLAISPGDILDVGFQLSYAAMAGIAYIFPHMNRLWPGDGSGLTNKGLRWVWTAASISIACQMTTGPIAYLYFGTFPKYFILTNLLATPLVTMIIPGSLTIIALYGLGICPDFAIWFLESLVTVLTDCLTIISSL